MGHFEAQLIRIIHSLVKLIRMFDIRIIHCILYRQARLGVRLQGVHLQEPVPGQHVRALPALGLLA